MVKMKRLDLYAYSDKTVCCKQEQSKQCYNQIILRIKNMAFIIQQLHNLTFQNHHTTNPQHIQQDSTHQQIINHFYSIEQRLIKTTTKHQNYSLILDPKTKSIVIRFIRNKINKKISIFVTIRINYQTNLLTISSKILNKKFGFAKIEGNFRRRMVVKNTYNRGNFQVQSKTSINMSTGQLKFDSPFYYPEKASQDSLEGILAFFTKLYTLSMEQLERKLQLILFLTDQQCGSYHQEADAHMREEKIRQIYRFSGLLNIYLNLSSETFNQQHDLILNLYKQAQSYRNLQRNRVQLSKDFTNLTLYSSVGIYSFTNKPIEEQPLDYLERLYFQKRLELPLNQRCPNPNQNFFVLNYIKLSKKIPQTNLRKIKKGGFTTIYLSEIEYWYVGSYCAGEKEMLQIESISLKSPPLKKQIIIKREDKHLARQCGKSRVAHQRLILTKIKFGLSMFLPKFYLLAQKDDTYANDLLVDYISSPNLSDYIENNKNILSLNTKIYIVLMIGQGLRYLKEYKIAHLDLKPTNIMTYRKLTFKLIDFGESYHPQIKDHQPGFSSPYSAPQNYIARQSYNYKNDVFSLGVIMYELLIGQYPFYFYDERLKDKVYTSGTYMNYWFQLPENMLMYGDPIVCPVIYYIMRKCLHSDPDQRPQLEWIVIILRECLDYLS